MKNIFISSPRRSGTHLITDLIVNNFGYQRIDNNIDFDFLTDDNVDEFINDMSKGGKLAWTHCHDIDTFFSMREKLSMENLVKIKNIFLESTIIYIYRDIRDTITSYYHRPFIKPNHKSFIDFYHNDENRDYKLITNNFEEETDFAKILTNQHKNWLSLYFSKELLGLDFHIITYEEVLMNYNESVDKVSKALKIDLPSKIKDVRIKSQDDKKSDIIYTDNDFRKGGIGDWKETFGLEWGKKVKEAYDDLLTYHVYAYTHNPKLHEFHDPERKYFQLDSKDWDKEDVKLEEELKKYPPNFHYKHINDIISDRYVLGQRKTDDVRYKHKIFFFGDKILKFIYPCKALLDEETFKKVVPIGSKATYLTVLKSHQKLYDAGIMPKVYYAGLYGEFLVIYQDRIPEHLLVNNYFNVGSEMKWDWIVDNKLFPMILNHVATMIKENILIIDHISPYNLAVIDDKLKYLDFDGIKVFDNITDLKNSDEYSHIINTFKNVDDMWFAKYNERLLEKYIK